MVVVECGWWTCPSSRNGTGRDSHNPPPSAPLAFTIMSSAVDDSDGEESSQELEESVSQELACSVHEAVWADFYDWEQGYCQNILDNLCRNDLGLKQNTNSALTFAYPEVKFKNIARAELNDSMIITRPSLGDGRQAHTKDRDCYTYLAPIVAPIPIYESCTPCVANIVNKERNEANLDLPILHFFPFVDDPSFVLEKYAKLFNAFIWQDDEQRDPDGTSSSIFSRRFCLTFFYRGTYHFRISCSSSAIPRRRS